MDKNLFIKYLNNECSPEEVLKVFTWFQERSGNIIEKSVIKQVWDEFETTAETLTPDDFELMLDKIHHGINLLESQKNTRKNVYVKNTAFRRTVTFFTKAAAVLFIPVLFTLLYMYSAYRSKQDSYTDNFIELVVPAGSVINTDLPDGTKVWLNQKSTIRYPQKFDKDSRKVYIEGEAYFDVKQEDGKPFIAAVNNIEVMATGTEFNIKSYPEDFSVATTLVSGRVVVMSRAALGAAAKPVCEMYPGQHMSIDLKSNQYSLKRDHVENYVSWKDGKLIFKEATLEQILERLGNWNNVEFVIMNKELENLTYTATFIDETLAQMLDLLEKAAPVEFRTSRRERMADGTYSKSKIYVSYRKPL